MGNYIKAIKIYKVRHLEGLTIPVSEDGSLKHVIITGKNGSGKTSLLDAMSIYLDQVILKNIYQIVEKRKKELEAGLQYYQKLIVKDVEIGLQILKKNKEDFSGQAGIKPMNDSYMKKENLIKLFHQNIQWFLTSLKGIELIFESVDKVLTLNKEGKYILAYFPVGHKVQFKSPEGIKNFNLNKKQDIKDNFSSDFLQYIVNMKAQGSFARDKGETEKVEQIDNWFRQFEDTLKKIFETDKLVLDFDYENFLFNILLLDREPFGLNQLSDGYSAIIQIITELILRAEALKLKAHEIEGIVLIDEIEAHLHVQLEKQILPFLTSFFPKIQFVVSTHSPFVLSSVSNVIIYDLENKEPIEDLSGYSYSAIVESYFGVNKYSDEVIKQIKRYEELVSKPSKTDEEKKKIIDLESYLDEIPKSLNKELFIKYSELKMKKEQ